MRWDAMSSPRSQVSSRAQLMQAGKQRARFGSTPTRVDETG